MANLRTVENAISINATVTSSFPRPTNAVAVTYSGVIAWFQGTVGNSVLAEIGMGESPIDPITKSEFSYSVTANGTEYEVGTARLSDSAMNRSWFHETANAQEPQKSIFVVLGNYNGLFVSARSE